jgi:UDP-N-acetylmuramyl pentapeptide phosphotransferase/UDP-N-acetylglucosamine-1-phosphate transferase
VLGAVLRLLMGILGTAVIVLMVGLIVAAAIGVWDDLFNNKKRKD